MVAVLNEPHVVDAGTHFFDGVHADSRATLDYQGPRIHLTALGEADADSRGRGGQGNPNSLMILTVS